MKPKTIRILLVLLLLFVATYALSMLWQNKKTRTLFPLQEQLENLKIDQVTQIDLSSPEATISLKKKSDGWEIDELPAASTKIEQALQTLKNAKVLELSSEREQSWPNLQVTEKDEQLSLRSQDKSILILILGKQEGSNQFIRLKNDKETYLLSPNLALNFPLKNTSWHDTKIYETDTKALEKIYFETPKYKFFISKKNSDWLINGEENNLADSKKVDDIIFTLAKFNAEKLIKSSERKNYPSKANFILKVTAKEEATFRMFKGDNDYLLNKDGDSRDFIILNSSAEKFSSNEQNIHQSQK